eukprot:CAMPEP_0202443440 /NCGR_PEP_ID=MMETSP1360-20130828/2704_1 /ASSEMBLY_ACC=CAM_ASM_000848 /TAXON_ID=515479 /ORGANISM="Licmophora paradoxa, Strain CCMP2313" /LENGTH=206 /DNA_ID=CAMNT_0049059125 /DNA_START=31 /DNA_END=648 /DNA_ORIENTATION=+
MKFFSCLLLLPLLTGSTTASLLRGIHKNGDPYDPVCLTAGMQSDDPSTTCHDTQDAQGDSCVWCDAAGVFGLCLSSQQAKASQQYLQCEFNTGDAIMKKEQKQKDIPIPPQVIECLQHMDEDDCNSSVDENGKKCTYCNTVAGFGICFSDEAKEAAKAEAGPLFQCDDNKTHTIQTKKDLVVSKLLLNKIGDPLDPSCFLSGSTDE